MKKIDFSSMLRFDRGDSRKRSLCAVIFLFIFASLVFAQGTSQNPAFKEVCKNISSHKITKGSFVQTKVIRKIKREIKSSGTFVIAGEEGLLWNTLKPVKSSMAITKGGILQTNAKGKRTIVSSGENATFAQFSSLITSLFNGDVESLDKNFEIEFIGSAESWNVNLVPKDSSVKGFIESIEMAGNKTIDSMVLNEASGDFTKYEFSAQTFADALTDEEKVAFSVQ